MGKIEHGACLDKFTSLNGQTRNREGENSRCVGLILSAIGMKIRCAIHGPSDVAAIAVVALWLYRGIATMV